MDYTTRTTHVLAGYDSCLKVRCHHFDSSSRRRRYGTDSFVWQGDSIQLDGVATPQSSLGNVLAVSPSGSRIAMAHWKDVRVWVVPTAFELRRASVLDYYANDHLDAQGNAHARSIPLPAQGVVHRLHFAGEDSLWGMTDEGLVCWHVGPQSAGKFHTALLPWECVSMDTC